ncbi:MAG: anaerobic ribonucleoside-triphosphate reductase activating protein [Oscillospiraceae bacterium]|jgi:pyruvate formate lyase activating enzyme|nr:anaerobic ribonucleoside-triphosphate reductase activating protein [Oscillospiraceae bacterium]
MEIGGLQKLTLLDYPGHLACIVFTAGCNLRCPFCHNAGLLTARGEPPDALFAFLDQRRKMLEGVVITGGEPLLQPDLPQFLQTLREKYALKIKLDTNASKPQALRELLERKLLDYVAMDVKNSREKYAQTAGVPIDLNAVDESIDLLLHGAIPYEFRTTIVHELHEPEDVAAIAKRLAGAKRYFLQRFRSGGDLLTAGLHPPSNEKLNACLRAARQFLPITQLRGEEI